jgi:NitT/TauT family transport system substrate-binding protein
MNRIKKGWAKGISRRNFLKSSAALGVVAAGPGR